MKKETNVTQDELVELARAAIVAYLRVMHETAVEMLNLSLGNDSERSFWALVVALLGDARIQAHKILDREGICNILTRDDAPDVFEKLCGDLRAKGG